MNHLAIAKELVSNQETLEALKQYKELSINLAIAHSLIALAEMVHTTWVNNLEQRVTMLEQFTERAEDDIEHLANRNPEVCNACGKPMRYDFNSRWNCLNMSCKEYCDDIPF